MGNIPLELENLEKEITRCMEIYDILDDFMYQFNYEDLNKKWEAFGSSKKIIDMIDSR